MYCADIERNLLALVVCTSSSELASFESDSARATTRSDVLASSAPNSARNVPGAMEGCVVTFIFPSNVVDGD